MKIVLHHNDLPDSVKVGASVAIDTEALGLNPARDRLCLVQLSSGDGVCHLIKFSPTTDFKAPHLRKILENPKILKIFHFGRFDIAILQHYLKLECQSVYCTKIASKLTRTFTDRHSLKDLCFSLLGVEISKQEQASDWGAATLTDAQQTYAATDVLYLHDLKAKLDEMLIRENRMDLAKKCFDFLPTCATLDLKGWEIGSLFSHK